MNFKQPSERRKHQRNQSAQHLLRACDLPYLASTYPTSCVLQICPHWLEPDQRHWCPSENFAAETSNTPTQIYAVRVHSSFKSLSQPKPAVSTRLHLKTDWGLSSNVYDPKNNEHDERNKAADSPHVIVLENLHGMGHT